MNINKIASSDKGSVHARNAINTYRTAGVDFAGLMRDRVGKLKFSVHAQTRMRSREIVLTGETMDKLEKAVSGAEQKGSRDALVLLSDLAFIVNVPNKTVVTAMDGDSIRDNIFTNIDSTVVAG